MSVRSSRVIYFLSIVMVIGTSLRAPAQAGLAIQSPSCRFQPCPIPSGQNGVAYADYFVATGGTPPYTWSAQSGALSACGISVTTVDVGGNYEGYLSGTAITGTCSGNIIVQDSSTPHPRKAFVGVTLTVNPSGVVYTLGSQQPYGVASYSSNTTSVTTKPLPADVMSHLYTGGVGGDAIAHCALTDCGGYSDGSGTGQEIGSLFIASPGSSDNEQAFYYSCAGPPNCTTPDPWGTTQAATLTGVQTVVFRYPSGALFPESYECLINVWDQSTGWVVNFYRSPCGSLTLPVASGCGSTMGTACPISYTYTTAATNLFTAADYKYYGSGGTLPESANQFAPAAGMLRKQELINSKVNHALIFTVDCVSPGTLPGTVDNVFPGQAGSLGKCGTGVFGSDSTSRPPIGALFFTDYTKNQLVDTICPSVPAWQCTMLTTMSTFGGYVGITSVAGTPLTMRGNEELESSEAWKYYYPSSYLTTDPFWAWANAEKGFDGTFNLANTGCEVVTGGYHCFGAMLSNLPRMIGPEGTDVEGNFCTVSPGCYPTGHVHMADQCVAKGYAGVTGGCF